MVDLTADKRRAMPASSFAGPGRSFPINDPTHARLAIGGATRSEHAGNISPAMAEKIKAAARRKLGGDTSLDKHHSLAIGGAHHALKGGHISKPQHDHIVKSARDSMGNGKGKPFGSLAP